jgi:signal transduction histidine kinase
VLSRLPLAVRGTLYAGATLAAVTAIQLWVLAPADLGAWAAVLAPFAVCTPCTYLVARRIVETRARALTDVFERFERGDVDVVPLSGDPEFRSASELFARLARELHDAKAQLEHRDVERRRLFSDVVHELGTPISSLLGLAEALERPAIADAPDARDRIVRAIGTESDRLARFVEDLREIAQLDDPAMALSLHQIDVADVATEIAETLNAVPDAPPVETRLSPTVALADATRIGQVCINLLSNARRYAPDARILLAVAPRGGRACISVDDGGPGVAEGDLPMLGQRLHRLDPSRTRRTGGSGLGLSIVRAIAARHGGEVSFSRSELGGLCVRVEIPSGVERA